MLTRQPMRWIRRITRATRSRPRRLPAALTLMLFCLAPPLAGCDRRDSKAGSASDPVIDVADNDPAMLHAIKRAHETAKVFLAELAKPPREDVTFLVKKPFHDGSQVEHMWLTDVTYDGKVFRGKLDNDPGMVRNARIGETYTVAPEDISDWMIRKGDRIHGAFTTRALLPKMSKAERDEYEAMLEPEPKQTRHEGAPHARRR